MSPSVERIHGHVYGGILDMALAVFSLSHSIVSRDLKGFFWRRAFFECVKTRQRFAEIVGSRFHVGGFAYLASF